MSTIKILKVGEYVGKNKEVDLLMGLSDDELNLFSTFILSKKLKKPFVVYLFDLYLGNQLNFPYNIIARAVEPIIFKKARHIIVTNDATKEYYIKKYGNAEKYSVIYNSAFPKKYAENILLTRNSKKTNIVFTGNINWPQESSLNDLLELISKSNESTINIAVYCPSPPVNLVKQYKDDKNIIFTFASQAEMPRIQSEADILFLPISWHTSSPDIVKTASPGKLTDYLIAGKPILIYAPEYSFVTRYAKENNFAEIVNKKDQNMLKGAIEKLINNKEYANLLVTNAKKTFYKHHDAVDNAIKLQKIINNL